VTINDVVVSVKSPEQKVVAVGLADGRTLIHNIEFDETLMTFQQHDWGPVTAISFRTGRLITLLSLLYHCYHRHSLLITLLSLLYHCYHRHSLLSLLLWLIVVYSAVVSV